jgi:hypothetical protein
MDLRATRCGDATKYTNAQRASGACAIALPTSAPARIVAANSVLTILSPSRMAGNAREAAACRADYL